MDSESSLVESPPKVPQEIVENPGGKLEGACCLLGFGRSEVLVDAEDIGTICEGWSLFRASRTSSGDYTYAAKKVDGRRVLLHRVITKAPVGSVVDHLNGNRLDNRRANLRICSHKENMQNRKLHLNNTSGFVGVSWSKHSNTWLARCQRRYLGHFKSKEDAATAYRAAALKAFSHLNGAGAA
jgi:hypothetical protein